MPSTKSTCQRPPTPFYFFDGFFIFFLFLLWVSSFFFVLLFATPLSYHIKCEFKIYTKHLHALGLIKHYAPVTLHTSWATKTIEAQQTPSSRPVTPSWSHANWHAVVAVATDGRRWLSLEFNLLAARENILFGRPMCRQRGFYGYSLAWMPRPYPRCHRSCSSCCCSSCCRRRCRCLWFGQPSRQQRVIWILSLSLSLPFLFLKIFRRDNLHFFNICATMKQNALKMCCKSHTWISCIIAKSGEFFIVQSWN